MQYPGVFKARNLWRNDGSCSVSNLDHNSFLATAMCATYGKNIRVPNTHQLQSKARIADHLSSTPNPLSFQCAGIPTMDSDNPKYRGDYLRFSHNQQGCLAATVPLTWISYSDPCPKKEMLDTDDCPLCPL